jgi:hypothetical protein
MIAADPELALNFSMVPLVLQMQKHPVTEVKDMSLGLYAKLKQTLASVGVTIDPGDDLTGFDSLVNSPQFHDLTLLVNGERIYAHKAILFGRSTYFRALFDRWLTVPSHSISELPINTDATSDVFIELLRFIYSGRCNFNENNVVPLLELADLYNLVKLTNLCEAALWDCVSEENVFDLLSIAHRFNAHRLRRALVGFAINHLPAIPDQNLWLLSSEHHAAPTSPHNANTDEDNSSESPNL